MAYCSRSLSVAEQHYAQIEKEALASTWACKRFSDYLIGSKFHLETDHKPLVSLLGSKNLEELPLQLQRFRMRLMRFTYTISYVPGKQLTIADALSCAPVTPSSTDDDKFHAEIDAYVNLTIQSIPTTQSRFKAIKAVQAEEEVCQKLLNYCKYG